MRADHKACASAPSSTAKRNRTHAELRKTENGKLAVRPQANAAGGSAKRDKATPPSADVSAIAEASHMQHKLQRAGDTVALHPSCGRSADAADGTGRGMQRVQDAASAMRKTHRS